MNQDVFADVIESEELRAFFDHWNACRGSRRMPGWSDIRPQAIRKVLPYVWAWKYDRKTDRFSGRLTGDEIHRVFGATNSGRPMEECFPERYYAVMFALFKRIVMGPEFLRERGPVYAHLGNACFGERIALPLADDGVTCDGIIGATLFEISRPIRADETRLIGSTEEWFALG
jgi:hypothetical protein